MTRPADARSADIECADLGGVGVALLAKDDVVEHVLGEISRGCGNLLVTVNTDILRQLQADSGADVRDSGALFVADGMPVVWAVRMSGAELRERVDGASLVPALCAACAGKHRVLLLGGTHGTADRAARLLAASCPGLEVDVIAPRYGFLDDEAAVAALEREVVSLRPRVVFVALGALQQERLSLRLLRACPEAWFVGCGGTFDFLSGVQRRAPHWMRRTGLEWVFRLSREPRRLARRYIVDDLPFAVRAAWRLVLARMTR